MSKVNWREWNEEAFREARRQNKPILLDIMATWCHWCHVMDATSYDDEEAAEIISREYIPIRVDTDRRPDVNTRYNMGGWPTTAFLTPDGDILTGATYIPPDRFRETLRRVAEAYRTGGPQLSERAAAIRTERARASTSFSPGSVLSDRVISDVLWAVRSDFDDESGGLGTQPKFPQPDAVELLLSQYHRTQETDLRDMALLTLDGMMEGEIYDSTAGGFFRYATMRDWNVPHFEKLLADQAGAVRNYVQAYQATTRKEYMQVARLTLSYVEETLLDPETGAFYGSQSADEEYYRLTPKERATRQAPPIDKTVYTNSNAEMSYSYLKAYEATLHKGYLETAERNVKFLLDTLRRPEGGMNHYFDGRSHVYGLLSDQSQTVWTLCEMYQATGTTGYLDSAREIASVIKAEFADSLGGFLDVTAQRAREERLPYRDKPLDLNGLTAKALIRLGELSGESDWRRLGEAGLRALAGRYKEHGYLASGYALAIGLAIEEPVEIALVGPPGDPRVDNLRRSALRSYEPYKLVLTFDPVRDKQRLADRGYPAPEEPRAFVCIAQVCQPPTGEPEAVEEAVARAGGHAEES